MLRASESFGYLHRFKPLYPVSLSTEYYFASKNTSYPLHVIVNLKDMTAYFEIKAYTWLC